LEDRWPWKVQGMQWRPSECRFVRGTKERQTIAEPCVVGTTASDEEAESKHTVGVEVGAHCLSI
jgi:hypothetical protein